MKKTVVLIVLCLFLSGCVTVYNPVTGKKEMVLFSDKAEVDWGNSMAQQFLKQYKILHDEEMTSRLQELGDKIAQGSHRNYLQYHFYIIDEDKVNAFAVPGGHIFVYKGLLDEMDEDQVAFVLAHEIGHVCARHAIKSMQASLGFMIISSILLRKPDQESTRKLSNQLFQLISLGFSRKDEFQADALGMEYTISAKYDPRAALSIFDLFKKLETNSGQIPFYLRTHPYPTERSAKIRERLIELKYIQEQEQEIK